VTVSIGVLGAARIVKGGLLDPAAGLEGVEVVAIAARDAARCREYALEHGIPQVLGTYDEVLDDPAVDAVYVPTPAALHGYWTRRAVLAGKHVLCEKPFAANADEAAEVADVAEQADVVVMEAFHSRHHPMWARMSELLRSGAIGAVQHAEASFLVPHADRTDIRWQLPLGGGALMDMGVYPVTLLRYLLGEPEVRSASARDIDGVDASMTIELGFAAGATGRVVASMWQDDPWGAELEVTGSAGTMQVHMPYHPQFGGRITLTTPAGTTTEAGDPRSSYAFMLEAFRDAVVAGGPVVTDVRQATATMRVVDAAYRATGMAPRQPFPLP
jgi:predicted dehydrogenase